MRCWTRLIEWARAERTSAALYVRLSREAGWFEEGAAGLWGDMSVGLVRWNNDVFVHCWKGKAATDLYKLAAKKPREMTPAEYDWRDSQGAASQRTASSNSRYGST